MQAITQMVQNNLGALISESGVQAAGLVCGAFIDPFNIQTVDCMHGFLTLCLTLYLPLYPGKILQANGAGPTNQSETRKKR